MFWMETPKIQTFVINYSIVKSNKKKKKEKKLRLKFQFIL